ncbi:MAG TPA: biotin transporter BioY, partial [Thermaerobacter sp.]
MREASARPERPAPARPAPAAGTATRQLILAALFAGLTASLAYVRIPLPFTPVPITGQTFGVMLSGLLLGPRWGAVAQAVYVLLGVVGLPVFAGGQAGPGVLLGPTGGYLVSYPLAAAVTGAIAGQRRVPGFARTLLACVAGGIAVVYALGVPWFVAWSGMAWREALVAAALPFLPGDLAKALAAALLGRQV